jgi:hypothetical protein
MASKDSKSGKVVGLAAGVPEGKVSIDRKRWDKAIEDKERANAILFDIGFDIVLGLVIHMNFPERAKDAQKLMDNPNINMALKAKLAYILQLINKPVRDDLLKIHEIRCRFAHSFDASYAYPEVLKLVKGLSTAKDHEVTAKNSYELFRSAARKCKDTINAILDKQKLQKAQKD